MEFITNIKRIQIPSAMIYAKRRVDLAAELDGLVDHVKP